jgi:hypothetical protein
MICFLSPGVEKTNGSPVRMSRAGNISQTDNWAATHGPVTHAMISARKRDPDVSEVSKG